MEKEIEVTISNYKNFLRYGDLMKAADLTKAQNLNKGKGFSHRYVQMVNDGDRKNPEILEILRGIAQQNVEAGLIR